jgi:hypothetical protein
VWVEAFSFADNLFHSACSVTDLRDGTGSSNVENCVSALMVTAIGGGWDFIANIHKSATTTVVRPAFTSFGVIPRDPLANTPIQDSQMWNNFFFSPGRKGRRSSTDAASGIVATNVEYDRTATMTLRHGAEDRSLTWWEYATANYTHRSSFWYDGKHGGEPAAIEFWHQPHARNASRWTTHLGVPLSYQALSGNDKRDIVNTWCNGQAAPTSWASNDGDLIIYECNPSESGGQSPGGGPGVLYYGIDAYAPNENSAFSWDMGTTNTAHNGFSGAVGGIATLTYMSNIWDQCICLMENGQWLATGSLQFSWDDVYNGYSQCWSKNCGS